MKVSILTNQAFPNGTASTNRIYFYAKGLIECGNLVTVNIFAPTEYGNIKNNSTTGVFNGVPFEYTCKTTIIAKNKYKSRSLVRQIFKFKKKILTIFGLIVYGVKISKQTDVIFVYLNNAPVIFLYLKLISLFVRSKIVVDMCEMPYFNKPQNGLFKWHYSFYKRVILKLFDGIIFINEPIRKNLAKDLKKNCEEIIVPILYDSREFEKTPTYVQDNNEEYLLYCGALNQKKDGVLTIIEAFGTISAQYPALKLKIIGDTDNTIDQELIQQYIKQYCLENTVELMGYVSRTSLISYLKKAKILLLAKPDNLQSRTCFPTKIAEYFSTGNPVLITKIGVVENFFKDMDSVIYSTPDDCSEFAKKINYILTNYEISKKIGLKGKEITINNFDYKVHSKRLNTFLRTLNENSICN